MFLSISFISKHFPIIFKPFLKRPDIFKRAARHFQNGSQIARTFKKQVKNMFMTFWGAQNVTKMSACPPPDILVRGGRWPKCPEDILARGGRRSKCPEDILARCGPRSQCPTGSLPFWAILGANPGAGLGAGLGAQRTAPGPWQPEHLRYCCGRPWHRFGWPS